MLLKQPFGFKNREPDFTPAIIEGCPVYDDNAAATLAGVPVGGLYRTATGVLMVRY